MSYPYRDGLIDKEWGTNGELAAERALTVIDKQIGAANLAAIIIEPILGEGGFIVPAPGFLPALREWCTENNVVFIADEVQSGFARTGTMFACEDEGIEPDLITIAKGVADGLPLSAVTGKAEIMDSLACRGDSAERTAAIPVACAAALATIETIELDGLCDRAKRIESLMKDKLGHLQADDDRIGDVRGRGAMIAVELVKSVPPNRTRSSPRRWPGGSCPGRAGAHLRDVRQHSAFPASTHHQRRAPARGGLEVLEQILKEI